MENSTIKMVPTNVLAGFMELLPADQILFDKMKSVITQTYESFGFIPLDTPLIERSEVLLAKAGGETEKQIYRFTKGEHDLSLRFDLTVPLARYVSEHFGQLNFPFRRYHIGKVYRGERPQKGRYREFYQCDIDIIGKGKLSLINDAEILSVIYEVFTNLKLPPFIIRINNRKLINGLMESLGLTEKAVEVMRIIDKIEKVDLSETQKSLLELGLSAEAVSIVLKFIGIKGEVAEMLQQLEDLDIDNEIFSTGLSELKEVLYQVNSLGLPKESYGVDLSIARGLDYYTGTVYETALLGYGSIGSICSGGRYDNLADNYTSQKLPGVGISIGLTRLFSQLKDLGIIQAAEASPSKVIILPFDKSMIGRAMEVSRHLRLSGVANEVYFEDDKFKNKISYASRLGIKYAVIIGEDEITQGFLTLKNMEQGTQEKISLDNLLEVMT